MLSMWDKSRSEYSLQGVRCWAVSRATGILRGMAKPSPVSRCEARGRVLLLGKEPVSGRDGSGLGVIVQSVWSVEASAQT